MDGLEQDAAKAFMVPWGSPESPRVGRLAGPGVAASLEPVSLPKGASDDG